MTNDARSLLPVTASPGWVIAAVLVYAAAAAVWVFSDAFPMQAVYALQDATGGWLNATLVLAVVFGAGQLYLLFGPGRQRARDLGWRWRALPAACVATLCLWLAMNASTVFAARIGEMPLAWQAGWALGGLLPGAFLAQLLGTALVEETVFRAWLWPQLALRFARRLPLRWAWLLALLASQGGFALLHVPVRLAGGAGAAELALMVFALFATGIVFALLYAATRSLFFVVGIHALGNAPTLLFELQGPSPSLVMLGVAIVIALGWWWRRRAV
jgi:membrane protease YdiL (CAAX protease family)